MLAQRMILSSWIGKGMWVRVIISVNRVATTRVGNKEFKKYARVNAVGEVRTRLQAAEHDEHRSP
jgi:hypothetical protein